MRIGIVLDNPKRDLSGIALLTYQLIKRTFQVYVIPMYEQRHEIPSLRLDAIIVNYARTSNLELLRMYKKMGITTFVLDTEGGIHPDEGVVSPAFIANRIKEIEAFKYVDHYFLWGPRMYEAFRTHSGIPATSLHLTGCPRFDICHEKWRGILKYDRTGYVLINLNFPSINPWWGRAEYQKENQRAVFYSAEKEISQVAKIVNVELNSAIPLQQERMKVLNEFIAVIKTVAGNHPDKEFVVRPHPFENYEVYNKAFAGLRNISVDGEGEVAGAISNAVFVVHLNCGSSADTRLLGKVPVSLEFLNSDLLKSNITTPTKISHGVRSVAELDDLISNPGRLKSKQLSEGEFDNYLYPWFYKCDGNATERIADIMINILQPYRPGCRKQRSYPMDLRTAYSNAGVKDIVIGMITQLIGSHAWVKFRQLIHRSRAMKYIGVDILREKLERIKSCEKGDVSISVVHAKHPISRLRLQTISVCASRPTSA